MFEIRKKQGKVVEAYRLGKKYDILRKLEEENKLIDLNDGRYEVFSQEAVNSESGHGQIAQKGDWIRLDSAGYPYPSKDEWFKVNMRHISGDKYEQIPKVLKAWTASEKMCPEIEFLIKEKGLIINKADINKYYYAILWGNPEVAGKDDVIVFYNISYADNGAIIDAEYNFVKREEFDKTYNIL